MTDHQIPGFQGPDAVLAMWADKGDGSPREYMEAQDAAAAAAAVVAAEAARDAAIAATSSKVDKISAPILVTDPAYGLSGTTDNTATIAAALTAAGAAGRGIHFPRRSSGDPYVVAGSGVILTIPAGLPSITADPGAVIKVKDSNGNYVAVMGGATLGTDLTGLVVDGLTIDQNSANNAIAAETDLTTGGNYRFCIRAATGDRVQVRNCRFLNMVGTNTVLIGLSAGSSVDARVQDCEFDAAGAGAVLYDHSSVWVAADGITITGNKFRGTLGGGGSRSAIETHGSNQVVTGNHVARYRTAAQITGITGIGSAGVLVSDNTVDDVLVGIKLWSNSGTNDGLRDAQVTHNAIRIDRDSWQLDSSSYPIGIILEPSNSDHIDGLNVSHNTIRILPFSATALTTESNACGIDLRYVTNPTLELRNFTVSNNTVVGALSAGIRVDATMKRGRVSNNLIVDPGSSTEGAMASSFRTGMLFANDMADVDVFDNRTIDTRGTHLIAQGFTNAVANAPVRSRQWNNSVTCLDGVGVPESTQTTAKRFANRPEPAGPIFVAGWYYGPQGGRTTVTATQSLLYMAPFVVGLRTQFVRIGAGITAAGAGGTVVRFGIYADNGAGLPGALILDAGTAAGDAIASVEVTIAQWLDPGLYHIGLVAQGGAPTVRATFASASVANQGGSSLVTATGANPYTGVTQASVTGALPNPFVVGGSVVSAALAVLRAA